MLPVGHILNETYRIERLLGLGGMAAVYVVSHMRLPRHFALKIIAANLHNQQSLLDRFRREAEILAALNHPHVVNVVDWNIYDKQYPYLVMDLLEGHDLAHHIGEHSPLSAMQALPIFLQIAEALQAAHKASIVHRDLKPANIFICNNGPFPNYIKVLDFGIAKVLNLDSPLQTAASALLGTPAYMAPEQAMGHNNLVDARTDQFALATILYEMLAGRPAFFRPGDSTLATLTRVVYEEPVALDDNTLWPTIRRALSKDPNQRFPTLREFVEATGAQELTASLPILQQRTRPLQPKLELPAPKLTQFSASVTTLMPETPLKRWRRRVLLYVGIATLVGLGVGGSVLLLRQGVPLKPIGPETSVALDPQAPPAVTAPNSTKPVPELPPLSRDLAAPAPVDLGPKPEPEDEGATAPTSLATDSVSSALPQRSQHVPIAVKPAATGGVIHKSPHATDYAVELTEHHGTDKLASPVHLTSETKDKLRACARAFYVIDGVRLRDRQLELAVLREPARFQFLILRTGFSFEQRGPREFDNCVVAVGSTEIPSTLSALTIRFAKKSAP